MAEEEYYDEEFEDDDFLDGSGPEASEESVSFTVAATPLELLARKPYICSRTQLQLGSQMGAWMQEMQNTEPRVSAFRCKRPVGRLACLRKLLRCVQVCSRSSAHKNDLRRLALESFGG
jgi:hypothetical protein